MTSDELTKEQCASIRCEIDRTVKYLARLCERVSYKGFPKDDLLRHAATDALAALKLLHSESLARSVGVAPVSEPEPLPPVDPLCTLKSAPRKDEKIRLGRIRKDTH